MTEQQLEADKTIKLLNDKRYELCTTAKKQKREDKINLYRLHSLSLGKHPQSYQEQAVTGFMENVNANYVFYQPTFQQPVQQPLLMGYTQQQVFNRVQINEQKPIPTFQYQTPTHVFHNVQNYAKQFNKIPDIIKPIKPSPKIPVVNRQYQISTKVLGQGAQSIVYQGLQIATRKRVAIKMITSHYSNNEIKIMKTLGQCENILKMYDYWVEKGKMFLVLELCDGSLQDLRNKANLKQRYQYFKQILNGMKHLDRYGILHRDIKLHNMLVKDGKVKLSDFGFAKRIGQRLTVESRQCGTPATMAPQVFFAQQRDRVIYDRKSDIWPLGIVLHQLVYNCHPFNFESRRMERGQRIKLPNPIRGIEKILNKILVVNVRARLNLQSLDKMFNDFLLEQSRPIVIEDDQQPKQIKRKIHHKKQIPLIQKPNLKNYQYIQPQKESIPIYYKNNNVQQPQLFQQTQLSSTHVYHPIFFTQNNHRQINHQTRTTFKTKQLIKGWITLCICLFILKLVFG